MRQSYFGWAILLWLVGHIIVQNQPDCGPRIYVNASAAPGGDGSSWATAFNKLQDAISLANSCAGISEIWVAQGTYYPDEGAGITDNDRGRSFNLKNGLAIYGGFTGGETELDQRSFAPTILSGEISGDNSIHVVRAIAVNNTAILDGFTITGGFANGAAPHDDGGGIYNDNSSPQIINCTISGNHAADHGGGMINKTASPAVINCSFSGNTAAGFGGGGAFANLFSSSPIFTYCSFSGNSAPFGGAGVNVNSSQTFINCSFSGNAASTHGGGMFNASCTPTFINCIFSTNLAAKKGAGMYNTNADVTIINCTFRGNSPIENGGGIYNTNLSDPVLTNCILWGNINGEIVNDGGSTATATYSIVKGGHPGTGNLDLDPLFVNSGDLRLQACSPAIDAGNNTAVTASTDVEGNTRIVNATNDAAAFVDMGAYEFTGTASTTKYYRDADGDGYGDPNTILRSCSIPAGYTTSTNDCNDEDDAIYPDATEVCDDMDNDCDGQVDEGLKTIYYADNDNDGLGDPNNSLESCEQPDGYVTNDDDDDDNCAGYTFTGVYFDLDGDTYGNYSGTGEYTVPYCENPILPGFLVYNNSDCNDNNPNVKPGAVEICDNLDNDCDGQVDEGFIQTFWFYDEDGDGYGDPGQPYFANPSCSQPPGYVSNSGDCNDSQFQGAGHIIYVDQDGDGYHGFSYTVCGPELIGNTTLGPDCNDANENINSGAAEICDGIDNNCDGIVDPDNEQTPPAFTGNYDDVSLACNPNAALIETALGTATATDASGPVSITSSDGPVITDGCNRSQVRTFTAKDGCNNTTSVSRTARWIADVTPPVFTGDYINRYLGCNPDQRPFDGYLGNATATDACGEVTITFTGLTISDGCNRSTIRIFTAKDGCNNTATISRTLRWIQDGTPPSFTGNYDNVILGASPTTEQIEEALGNATADDACSATSISSLDGEVISEGCTSSQTRTFKAKDGCGNQATISRTVTWTMDSDPPTLTTGGTTLTLGCRPAASDIVAALGTATASDACGPVSITSSDGMIEVIPPCLHSQTRTFTAIDGYGNTATAARTITWINESTPPGFIGNFDDVILGCNPSDPASYLGDAPGFDICGSVYVTHTDGQIETSGCTRSIKRTFTGTDACGNTATISRTVRWTEDVTAPTLIPTGTTLALGCNPSAADIDAALGTATATDAWGIPTVTSSDGDVTGGCTKSQTRTFTAKDGCGNTSTVSRTVTWTYDQTPPTLTPDGTTLTLGCNPTPADIDAALGTATATDACGTPTVTSGTSTVTGNCTKSQTRTFRAQDGCGNTSTISRTVTWKYDQTPPTLTPDGTTLTLGCNPTPADIDVALGTATATDACGTPTVTSGTSTVTGTCTKSQTRTFTAQDGCGNTSTVSRTVTWTYDVTAPTLTCAQTGTVTKSTNAGQCSYSVNGAEFNPSASDVCGTPSLSWTVTGATTTSGITTMAGVKLNFGANTIKWTATDDCSNTSTCSFIVHVNKVTTATSLVVSTTPATDPVTQQYSDKITCVATVTPANCSGAGPIGGTVTFKIITTAGTVILGSAPVGSDGKATLTDTLLENQLYPGSTTTSPTNGPLKPGNKTVTAEYSDTDPDYIVSNPTAPLVVACEDAELTYNGLNYFGANPNTNEGTITVSAFVLDTNDVNDVPAQARGDIRNATVTFREGTSAGAVIGTTNIPVGLLNPANYQEGIVTTNKAYTLTTQDINCGGKIVEVWAGANNYYCGEFDEVVPVCLSLPGGDFVTGGGWIRMQNSQGSYAGTVDKKMHAAIVFKWNKSNKNLQGNATIIYKRVVNGVQKVYQIKSNSITSMIVNNVNDAGTVVSTGATYRMAQIVTKANFRDLTDPDFPIALFGNLTLTITAWESITTQDGSKDRISIQLVGTGSQGLVFSSNWVNGASLWQQLGAGKMRVRNPSTEIPCTSCSGSSITSKPAEVEKAAVKEITEPVDELRAVVSPNPSHTNFRISIVANNLKQPVQVLVTDMLGRVIETRSTMAGNIITLGDKYRSGTYVVNIIQGKQSKQLKLVKLPD